MYSLNNIQKQFSLHILATKDNNDNELSLSDQYERDIDELLLDTYGPTYTDKELASEVSQLLLDSDDNSDSDSDTKNNKEESEMDTAIIDDDDVTFLEEIKRTPSPSVIRNPSPVRIHVTTYVTFNEHYEQLHEFSELASHVVKGDTTTYLSPRFYDEQCDRAAQNIKNSPVIAQLIKDGVTIILGPPQVYYEERNHHKFNVYTPLTPAEMPHMPEPRYRKSDDTVFSLFSVYYPVTLNYGHLVNRLRPRTPSRVQQHRAHLNAQRFIKRTHRFLQRLQQAAETQYTKGPEVTLHRMTRIILDYATDAQPPAFQTTRPTEPYVPTSRYGKAIGEYTPTPCSPPKQARRTNQQGRQQVRRQSLKDRLGPKHLDNESHSQ